MIDGLKTSIAIIDEEIQKSVDIMHTQLLEHVKGLLETECAKVKIEKAYDIRLDYIPKEIKEGYEKMYKSFIGGFANMNLMDCVDKINEELNKGFKKVEVDINDFRNQKHIIYFWQGQDIGKKVCDMANHIGDGHEVINIRGCI